MAYTVAFIVCSFPRIANDMRRCLGFLDLRFKLGSANDCIGTAGIGLKVLTGSMKQ